MLLGYSVTLAARNRRKVGKNIGRGPELEHLGYNLARS